MNAITRYTLILAALLGCALLCSAQSPPPPAPAAEYSDSAWKEFTSAEGRFSVMLPGKAQTTTLVMEAKPEKIAFRTTLVQTGAGVYTVMYNDMPLSTEDPKLLDMGYDTFRDGVFKGDDGMKLLNEREIIFAGKPAREWLTDNGLTVIIWRIVLVKERLYFVTFTTLPGVAFSSGRASAREEDRTDFFRMITGKFFGSFKVTPRQPGASEREVSVGVGVGVGTGTTGPTIASARAEGEVDKLLRELKQKNELVYGRCLDSGPCTSLKGRAADGRAIEGDMLEGKALALPQPSYPPIARAAHASGAVTVKVVLDEDGKVIAAQVESGHPLLQSAALKAAREARFAPTTLGLRPVKVMGTITYNFVLN